MPVQWFTEAIRFICTVISTFYPIAKDLYAAYKKRDRK